MITLMIIINVFVVKEHYKVSRTGQVRMKNWNSDHCHETETFRGWICHHCNTGLGAFTDSTYKLGKAMQYLDKHKSKLERQEFLYSEKDLPDLREELKQKRFLQKNVMNETITSYSILIVIEEKCIELEN